ncbi:protein serine/threonine phosphatase 2C [Lophium mytilinum]|uniref:Protein serine/threonine phosphatase 2C n=1 Tax=Lophium mytilinum TaxID=390894 RepID=A0A6A6REH2_9PEZI|nr:protein serine/threonine phosphatase 2C [Lophium mytilinum]
MSLLARRVNTGAHRTLRHVSRSLNRSINQHATSTIRVATHQSRALTLKDAGLFFGLSAAFAGGAVIGGIYGPSKPTAISPQSACSSISPNETPRDPFALVNEPVSLNVQTATAKLIENELSVAANGKNPESHTVQFASNSPVEDQYVQDVAPGAGKTPWCYWGVFDGHAGAATGILLKSTLVPYVSKSLSQLSTQSASPLITSAIQSAFSTLDADILNTAQKAVNSASSVSPAALAALAPAIAGSCALLAIFDPQSSILRVACVGDSRAVLGRYESAAGKYVAMPLSADQTGFNAAEVERISAAHPGEIGIIDPASGRLLGIAVTRAFGDSRWKWSEQFLTKTQLDFWSPAPRKGAVTPPYMTAEPVVTETQVVRGERGDFVILASDGLWDHISSEDAVECVAQYVEARKSGKFKSLASSEAKADDSYDVVGGKPFTLTDDKFVEWQATPEHFVVEDNNAATHLVKNAFGGSRRSLFCSVMSAGQPLSRNIRDDITVQVIFFD